VTVLLERKPRSVRDPAVEVVHHDEHLLNETDLVLLDVKVVLENDAAAARQKATRSTLATLASGPMRLSWKMLSENTALPQMFTSQKTLDLAPVVASGLLPSKRRKTPLTLAT